MAAEQNLINFDDDVGQVVDQINLTEIVREFDILEFDGLEFDNLSQADTESVCSADSDCLVSKKTKLKIGKNELKFQMVPGKRRDKTILHSITEHQLYVRNKVLVDGTIGYTCQNKNCYARVFLKNDKCFFSEPFFGHKHGTKESEIAEMGVLAAIKNNCEQPSSSQTTSQISEVREIFDQAVMV